MIMIFLYYTTYVSFCKEEKRKVIRSSAEAGDLICKSLCRYRQIRDFMIKYFQILYNGGYYENYCNCR